MPVCGKRRLFFFVPLFLWLFVVCLFFLAQNTDGDGSEHGSFDGELEQCQLYKNACGKVRLAAETFVGQYLSVVTASLQSFGKVLSSLSPWLFSTFLPV